MAAVLPNSQTPAGSGNDEIAKLRVPPHSIEAEQSVLGGLLLDANNIHVTAHNLRLDPMAWLNGLPGEAITFEHLMDQTAITYPQATLNELSGEQIKAILEDVADNLLRRADDVLYQAKHLGRNQIRVAV